MFSTGQATAFPHGLKMKASAADDLARAKAVCDGASACEREDDGGCEGYEPSDQKQHGFLPIEACYGISIIKKAFSLMYFSFFSELELNIKFPTCWDGVNLESKDGVKHVVYSEECDGNIHNECFDFDCPASHPVKLPEIHLYVRVLEYEGGPHVFADGTDVSENI